MRVMILCLLALILLLLGGCAHDTIAHRKRERPDAYAKLPQDIRALVDAGQIKVGMPPDAVYIAWGQPDQVLSAESEQGSVTTWLYHNTHLESYRYWTTHGVRYRDGYRTDPYLATDYYVRPYISAEIIFEEGVVKEWRTFPYPVE